MSLIQRFLIDFKENTTTKDLEEALHGLSLYVESRGKRLQSAKWTLVEKGVTLRHQQEAVRSKEEDLNGVKSEEAAKKEELAKRNPEKQTLEMEEKEEPCMLCDSDAMSSPEVHAFTPPKKENHVYFYSLDSPPDSDSPSLQNKASIPPSSYTAASVPKAPFHRRSRKN